MSEQPTADSAIDPIEKLAAVLSGPEEDKPVTEADSQPEAEEVEGDTVVEDEVEADTEASDEAEDGQAEDAEGEADTEEESGDDESDDKPITVEIDGEELPLDEVKLGYLRQADYTRKTQAVAEQRKAAEEERQELASTLNHLLVAVGADVSRFDGVDWERAAADNPEQYQQAKAAYEHSLRLFNGIKSQAEDFMARAKDAQQQALKAQAKESIAVLKTTIPGWSNDLYAQIGEYAQKELGFKPEEFNNIADHRAIQSIWKAMQYDRGRKVATEKTVKVAPKKTLSDKKAAESKIVSNRKEQQAARAKLRSSGRVDDAVALLVNRMR